MNIKEVISAAVMLFSLISYPLTDTAAPPAQKLSAASEASNNPFNKQDDKEVPYDGSRWIQPREWNVTTIDPKDYKDGIMLFADKIGLDLEYAKGKVQRVYFSIVGAEEPVGLMKFHIFYDTRLTVKENSKGEVITTGKVLTENDFTSGAAMIEEGELAFYAVGDDTKLRDSSLFTIDFIVPENAQEGDRYPIGFAYVDDGIVADTFIKNKHDEAGRLQMTYLFRKGIYNGYIKINGEKKVPVYDLGDVNNDGQVNAVDASAVLSYYAKVSTNKDGGFDESQKLAADADRDGFINAIDASAILAYYAYVSTTQDEPVSFEEYMNSN